MILYGLSRCRPEAAGLRQEASHASALAALHEKVGTRCRRHGHLAVQSFSPRDNDGINSRDRHEYQVRDEIIHSRYSFFNCVVFFALETGIQNQIMLLLARYPSDYHPPALC